MKKIINGKRYDTATATEVAEWSNGLGYSDFKLCEVIEEEARNWETPTRFTFHVIHDRSQTPTYFASRDA